MAGNDKEDTARRGQPGEAPMGPRRPTPTIELEAEEVEVRPTEDAAQRDADAGKTADSAPGDEGGEGDGASDAAEDSAPLSERDAGGQAAGAPPPPPRSHTEPRELRGFLTHLAAGLAGGVIGVLAAGYGLGHLPLGTLLPAPAEDPRIAQLADRLTALDARTDAVAAMAREGPQAVERVDRLERTLAALEEGAREGDGVADAASLAASMTRLGDRLDRDIDGLRQDLAQAIARNESEREALRADLARLGADLSGLRQGVEARAAEPAVDPQALARLDALDARLAALEQAVAHAAENSGFEQARVGALALAFAGLRRAADAGEPYAAELAAVEALVPPDADLAALKARARSGVPSAVALARALPEFMRKAEVARDDPPPASPSLMDRLLASARSVVTVRRAATGDGGAADDATARMQALVEAGDLAGAVTEGERLDGPVRAALEPWLADARARARLDAGLTALEGRVLAALGASAGEEGRR